MNVRGFRNLLTLTGEVERQVRAAGRVPPPKEYVMSVLAGHAKLVTRAAKAAREAEDQAVRARALARECADSALQMADCVAAAVIESTPAPRSRLRSILRSARSSTRRNTWSGWSPFPAWPAPGP